MEQFIGIDLGTTYSAVSTIDQYGKPVILKNDKDENLTPSVIYFENDGTPVIGSEAKEMLLVGSENVAMFFKRNMGNKDFYLTFHGRQYTATDLSAILLKKLKEDAEAALGKQITKAVITVPAYFNDLQRNETIAAAKRTGLDVLRIINEPTAAAIMYGSNNNKLNRKIIVYDLGGGTFDVTVLEISDQTIKVLSTGGDHELGGKDWDDKILGYISEQFIDEFGEDQDPLDTIESYNDLAFKAENIKKQLSNVTNATFSVSYNGNQGKYSLTREKFEELTQSLLHSTTFKTQEVLDEADLTWSELDGVLLVGGSTKMPMVANWVKEMSGREPLRGINVDEAVCFGAAIQAQMEMNARPSYKLGGATSTGPKYSLGGMSVVDVMSHSLGLIAINADSTKYINSIIIPKNLPIPSSQKRPYQFKTRPGNPNELDVYLTQGEVDDVSKCIIVSKYVFEGIEHLTTGKTVIDIEYQYDSNGIISVFGKQRETGRTLTARKCPLPDDMSWLYRKPEFTIPHLSVMLAIDLSYSMEGSPLKKAIEAAQNFADKIDLTNASVGLLVFATKEKILCPLTQNSKEISNGIKEILKLFKKNEKNDGDIIGFGNESNPLLPCHKILSSRESPRYMIVLTDGEWDYPQRAIQSKQLFVNDGMDIIAIGFGGANEKFLKAISTSSEHAIFTSVNNLAGTFGNIAQELTEGGGGGLRKT